MNSLEKKEKNIEDKARENQEKLRDLMSGGNTEEAG